MKAKKHVYVQKPLTWSIREARIMREVAAETGVVTQMGNQGTAEDGLREAVEVIRSGAIGSVSELHVWQIVRSGHRGLVAPLAKTKCLIISTGIPGLVLPKCVLTKKVCITPSIGAVGLTLERVPWATWPAIPQTCL